MYEEVFESAFERKLREFKPPFEGYILDELISKGDIEGAHRHAIEMLAVVKKIGDKYRAEAIEN